MNTDEKIAVLAKAIKALAEKAASTWEYDGGQVGSGVDLPRDIESALDEILQSEESGK